MKTFQTSFTEPDVLKALAWAKGYPFVCWLDGNGYFYPHEPFKRILAVGRKQIEQPSFEASVLTKAPDSWWFGYLGYDALVSDSDSDTRETFLSFPNQLFFEADVVIVFEKKEGVSIHALDPQEVWVEISKTKTTVFGLAQSRNYLFTAGQTKVAYLNSVEKVQDLIREGDVYELNHCQFFTTNEDPDGLTFYLDLNQAHPMPFSGWFKGNQFEIASASPERYLKKEGSGLVSQPIKGTIRRGANPEEDERLKHQLRNSEKERAENMMIVDLVRNDLARVSVTGSTTVEEMFGIYPFPKVFQMISTVTSVLKPDLTMLDSILSSFPMGSMTGAPKIEVMKQIANLEPFKRGAFSGALGYFGPEETFDFNVLIRSFFINHQIKQSGFAVGSAITIDSVGQEEWEECKLKAAALLALCGGTWEE